MVSRIEENPWRWYESPQAQSGESVLASRASKERDFGYLLELVTRHWPAVLADQITDAHGATSLAAAEQLLAALHSDTRFHNRDWAHNALVRCLTRVRERSHLNIPVPNWSVPLPYERPTVTLKEMAALGPLRELEKGFVDSLQELDPRGFRLNNQSASRFSASSHMREYLAGQALFCAARFGGLTTAESQQALQDVLHEFDHSRQLLWTGDDLVVALRNGDTDLRHWVADPLSAILMFRLTQIESRRSQLTLELNSAEACLASFIACLATPPNHRISTAEFLRACSVARSLEMPPYLHAFEAGRLFSVPWRLDIEARVRLGYRSKIIKIQTPKAVAAAHLVPAVLTQHKPARRTHDPLQSYRDLYACIPQRKHGWRGNLAINVEKWVEKEGPRVGPIEREVAKWLLAMSNKERPLAGHENIHAPSTVQAYLSSIGRQLFVAAAGVDRAAYDNEEFWLSIYSFVLTGSRHPTNAPDTKTSERDRKAKSRVDLADAARECQSLHDFIVARHAYVVPGIDIVSEFGLSRSRPTLGVNANYVAPHDFETAYEWLAATNHDLHHAQMMSLAYWTGLRVSELCGLRFADLVGLSDARPGSISAHPEVYVRAHYWRGLKSSCALRRLPLTALMPKTYLNALVSFCGERLETVRTLHGENYKACYLFAHDDSSREMPPADHVRAVIQDALRRVTGDARIVVHHLRHSAATNLLLMLSASGRDDPVWKLFPQTPALLMELAERLRPRLGLHRSTRRAMLWVVSGLLGHADPKTTLASYVHILDWLIECDARRVTVAERYMGLHRSIKLDAVLLNINDEAARVWRQGSNDKTNLAALMRRWGHLRNPLAIPGRRPIILPKRQSRLIDRSFRLPDPQAFDLVCRTPDTRYATRALGRAMQMPEHGILRLRTALACVNQRVQLGPRGSHDTSGKMTRRHTNLQVPPIPYPRLHADLADLDHFWTALTRGTRLLRLWPNTADLDYPAQARTPKTQAAFDRLMAASDAFLAASVKDSKALSFCGKGPRGLPGAQALLSFLAKYYPPQSIEVEAHLCRGQSSKLAKSSLQNFLGHKTFAYKFVESKTERKLLAGWRYGWLRISLLRQSESPGKSYGAWYSMYCCCLMSQVLAAMRESTEIGEQLQLLY